MSEEQFNLAMERIRNKDKSALKEIYEAYISFIYHTILNIVKQKEAAEDITSEFFIKLWERADSYKSGNAHKGYLATIARNMAIDYLRKYGKEVYIENDDDGDDSPADGIAQIADTAASPENQVIENLSVEQALSRLKPVYRQILTMKILSEMTFKEISDVLNIPIGTVTWDYQDALKQLRRFGYE